MTNMYFKVLVTSPEIALYLYFVAPKSLILKSKIFLLFYLIMPIIRRTLFRLSSIRYIFSFFGRLNFPIIHRTPKLNKSYSEETRSISHSK